MDWASVFCPPPDFLASKLELSGFVDDHLEDQRFAVACRKASNCIAFSKESKNFLLKGRYFLDILILSCRNSRFYCLIDGRTWAQKFLETLETKHVHSCVAETGFEKNRQFRPQIWSAPTWKNASDVSRGLSPSSHFSLAVRELC